jgi:hypothetical protein
MPTLVIVVVHEDWQFREAVEVVVVGSQVSPFL